MPRRPVRKVAVAAGGIVSVLLLGLAVASLPVVPLTALDWYAPTDRPFEATDVRHAGVIVLLGAGADRVREAARVYGLLGRPWLISSGGVAAARPGEPSAVHMRDALVRLGVPAERIVLERASTTTREEAVMVAPMLRRLDSPSFVLVTSRSHMRRALAAFRAEGLDPTAAASREETNEPLASRWTPSFTGLRLSRAIVHELIGLAYYRIRRWTVPGASQGASVTARSSRGRTSSD